MRNQALDILRLIAVLGVFGAHLYGGAPYPSSDHLAKAWFDVGWTGVDLFFVLSGFLVSGLLFADVSEFGHVRGWRFLQRRGLKIYPAFYVYTATVLAVLYYKRQPIEHLLPELAFFQNYFGFLWMGHTWSLAVEEHFYLLLLVTLLLCHPRRIPWIVFSVCVVCLALRCWTLFQSPLTGVELADNLRHSFPTHLRLDSLAFGVLLRYWFQFHSDSFISFSARWRWPLIIASFVAVTSMGVWPDAAAYRYTIGYTVLYAGYGALLAAVIGFPPSINWLLRVAAKLGSYSYSTYLWHMAVMLWVARPLAYVSPIWLSFWRFAAVYIVCALACGVIMYHLVELPVLLFRDRKIR